MANSLLVAQEITYTVDSRELFSNLTLQVQEGKLVGLNGPNGSGKTTLLRVLLELQRPHHGKVTRYATSVGYVGHKPGLTGLLTLAENIRWILSMSRLAIDDKEIRSRLAQFELGRCFAVPVNELSAGQVKRGALCALSLSNHQLWVLDEPMASLDAEGEELVASMLNNHRNAGGAAIVATHIPIVSSFDEHIGLGSE